MYIFSLYISHYHVRQLLLLLLLLYVARWKFINMWHRELHANSVQSVHLRLQGCLDLYNSTHRTLISVSNTLDHGGGDAVIETSMVITKLCRLTTTVSADQGSVGI